MAASASVIISVVPLANSDSVNASTRMSSRNRCA